LSLKKESSKIKMLESNRGKRKMIEKNLTFPYDSAIINKQNKDKEILDLYLSIFWNQDILKSNKTKEEVIWRKKKYWGLSRMRG